MLRRSLGNLSYGDGWAVLDALEALLAEGRLLVASVTSGHIFQPAGIMPLWTPYCLEAMAVCHRSLTAPSGSIPSNDNVVPELIK
jgi:hypothetical protein